MVTDLWCKSITLFFFLSFSSSVFPLLFLSLPPYLSLSLFLLLYSLSFIDFFSFSPAFPLLFMLSTLCLFELSRSLSLSLSFFFYLSFSLTHTHLIISFLLRYFLLFFSLLFVNRAVFVSTIYLSPSYSPSPLFLPLIGFLSFLYVYCLRFSFSLLLFYSLFVLHFYHLL